MTIFEYIKKIIQIIIWPVIFIAGQFFIMIIFSFGYISTIKVENIDAYIKTEEYKLNLASFLNNNKVIITAITFIIFILIFVKVLKKLKVNNKKHYYQKYLLLIPVSILIAIVVNSIFYASDIALKTNILSYYNLDIGMILCMGIMGPILEELLFRGIIYNKLLGFLDKKKATFFTSLLFALIHSNIYQMIYTFILSYILIYYYDKYKNIKAPIIIHSICNIVSYIMVYVFLNSWFSIILIVYLITISLLFYTIKYKKSI